MATTYLSKTFGSAGSLTTWTLSLWLKKTSNGIEQRIISCDDDASGNNDQWMKFDSADILQFSQYQTGYTQKIETNRKFRDCSGWYNIVLVWDTTNAEAGDRTRIYVNGVRETSFSSEVQASSSLGSLINNNTYPLEIGRRGQTPSQYFPGLISNIVFVDGTALAPTEFGEVDSTSGIWKFKAPAGLTYDTNGFWLKGENSGALGTDSSGEGNTFTTYGSPIQSIDTPSNGYNTLNSNNNYYPAHTLSNANTSWSQAAALYSYTGSTLGVTTGKWYTEMKVTSVDNWIITGITGRINPKDIHNELGQFSDQWGYIGGSSSGGANSLRTGDSSSSYGDSYTTADIISIAMDLDNNKLYFAKNGTWQDSGDPTSGATGTGAVSITAASSVTDGVYFFAACNWDGDAIASGDWNFGNGYFGTTVISSAGTSSTGDDSIWEYDCPTGYYGLNTKNINTYG